MTCPLNTYCPVHDFHHGGEAEQLRRGIEQLIAGAPAGWFGATVALRRLLDRVDARDSLAYLEARAREQALNEAELDADCMLTSDCTAPEHQVGCPQFKAGG